MRRLSSVMGDAAGFALRRFGDVHIRLILSWVDIVGDDIASISFPKRVICENGKSVLILSTVSGSAAVIVQHSTHLIVDKIKTFFGSVVVDSIKVIGR